MDVLVVESESGAASGVVGVLRSAGHTVHRCHEEGLPAFPCRALQAGSCPIDEGVDVAVTVRPHVRPTPAPLEDGVVCALRRGVPVVLAGRGALNPFEDFGVLEADPAAVVDACDSAVAARERELGTEIERMAITMFDTFGIDHGGLTVKARLRHSRIEVALVLPRLERPFDTSAVAALRHRLGQCFPWAVAAHVHLVEATRGASG